MDKTCRACEYEYGPSGFSKNQYRKRDGEGRCLTCVYEGSDLYEEAHSTGRKNDASSCVCDREPFAYGSFKIVYRGEYTSGKRASGFRRPCVEKVFRNDVDSRGSDYFGHELRVVEKAVELVDAFNAVGFIDDIIRVNRPEVWGDRLVEPFISGFQKFNSNTGWVGEDRTSWIRVMQALSHFSYAHSNGRFLLCDLQGGLNGHGAILTDPVINSRDGSFGPSDLGSKGISTFFSQHECTEYCRRKWIRPRNESMYFQPREGSSLRGITRPPHRRTYLGGLGAVYE